MRCFLLVVTLAFSFDSHAGKRTQDDWRFLIPREYHGDEAPHYPGGDWLALVAVGGVWRLEATIVRSTLVEDGVLDIQGEKTGIKISSSIRDAVALLRYPEFKPGKVDTPTMRFKDNPRQLSLDAPLKISFKGEEYSIEASTSGVQLRKGETKTLLSSLSVGGPESEDSAALLWAGDLDGDGKLDFLFDYSGHNSGGACLYLSAGAGEGALVREAACHGGIGC